MKYLIAIQVLFFFTSALAQNNLYTVSEAIGDNISLDEKKKYLLYKDINDSLFLDASIYQLEDGLFINHINLIDSVKLIDTLSWVELHEITIRLEKIDEYYNYLNSKDSTDARSIDLTGTNEMDKYHSLDRLNKLLKSKEIIEQLIPLYNTNPESMKWKSESMQIYLQQQQSFH